MDPKAWREMVDRSRELENALGTGLKQVEKNETDTIVLQRRAIRTTVKIPAGTILTQEHFSVLRPCPEDALQPSQLVKCIGMRTRRDLDEGEYLKWIDLD
jgi:N-acetylneuraminate synthase